MKSRYQYVLSILILAIVYEISLIAVYKYRDFQINSYIGSLENENARTTESINQKKEYLAYVRTNAYLDRIAKASQNRKNPGEEAVFLVDEKDMKEYERIDVSGQIVRGSTKPSSKTAGMSNREKWFYYALRIEGG